MPQSSTGYMLLGSLWMWSVSQATVSLMSVFRDGAMSVLFKDEKDENNSLMLNASWLLTS